MSRKQAREQAFARSRGICQFCGCAPAEEGHHWAGTDYAGPSPPDFLLKGDDLTALCKECHYHASKLRAYLKRLQGTPPAAARGATDKDSIRHFHRTRPLPSKPLAGVTDTVPAWIRPGYRYIQSPPRYMGIDVRMKKFRVDHERKRKLPPDYRLRCLPLEEVKALLEMELVGEDIFEMVAAGYFPRPVRISPRKSGWLNREVDYWKSMQEQELRTQLGKWSQPNRHARKRL